MKYNNIISLFKTSKYSERFHSIPIEARELDFFVAYSIYEVHIDVSAGSNVTCDLDFFEDAVLNLLSYKPMVDKEIADIMCIDIDLAKEILTRLYAKNYLEDNCIDLSIKGKLYCNKEVNKKVSAPVECLKRYILKLNTKDHDTVYLPLLLDDSDLQQYKISIEDDDGSLYQSENTKDLQINFGSKGKPLLVKGKKYGKPKDKATSVDKGDICKIIEEYNDLYREKNPITFNNIHDLDCEYKGVCWVHCKAVLLKNRDQVIISDGYSEKLFPMDRYIPGDGRLDVITAVKVANGLREQINSRKENTILNERNLQYIELEQLLHFVKKDIATLQKVITVNYEGENKDNTYRLYVKNTYSAFEWTLFYYLKGKRIPIEIKNVFEALELTLANKVNLIAQSAQNLGVRWKSPYKDLFYKCASYSLKEMSRKVEPDLWLGLGQAILASSRKPEKGFYELCQEYPNLISSLYELKKERDKIVHSVEILPANQRTIEHIYELLINTISCLLPDFLIEDVESNQLELRETKNSIYNDYFVDELVLQETFSTRYVQYIMTDSLKDSWIILITRRKRIEISDFLSRLYQNMQSTLVLSISREKYCSKVEKENLLEELKNEIGNIEVLKTVNKYFIEKAFEGLPTTLGAVGIVFLYYLKCNKFKVYEKIVKANFIQVLEFVVAERGHDNRVILNVSYDRLEQVYQMWVRIVEIIGEEL